MSEERCAAHSNSTAFEILDTLSQDLESTKSFFFQILVVKLQKLLDWLPLDFKYMIHFHKCVSHWMAQPPP